MKQKYISNSLIIILLLTINSFSQNKNNLIDTAGDIAFVAYHDTNDGFSFALLDNCPQNTSIRFIDEEWDGTKFYSATAEGEVLWTNTSGNIIPRGTIITIINADDNINSNGIQANIGTAIESKAGFTTANIDELFAITGTRENPGTFLAYIGDANTDNNTLTGTGLTVGSNAIFISEEGYYSGTTICNQTIGDCATMLNNISNWTIGEFNFPATVITILSGTAINETNTWTGTSSSDWNNKNNWSNNNIPTVADKVIIPYPVTHYPTVTSNTNTNSITIESGASLIANASITGNTTYKRAVSNNYHLVASPVQGETFQNIIANHNFTTGIDGNKIGIAPYDNNAIAWNYLTESSSGNLNSGTGFLVKLNTAGNLNFTGTINTSPTNVSISKNNNGYNLVGNPFVSYINSTNLLADNSSKLAEETIWIWNGNNYEAKVTSDNFILAPGQAFFVEAKNSNDNLIFDNNYQSHNETDTFNRNFNPEVQLTLKSNTLVSTTKIKYSNNATLGFDNGGDGTIFSGLPYDFAIFSHLVSNSQGKNFAIQSLPIDTMETNTIPLGIKANSGQAIEITANANNIPMSVNIILEDKLTNTFTNLLENSFTTTLNSNSNGIGRFYLHVTSQTLSTPSVFNQHISIYKSAKNTITISGLTSKKAILKVHSILGKEVFNKEFISNGITTIKVPSLNTGIYIFKISSEGKFTTKKIVLE